MPEINENSGARPVATSFSETFALSRSALSMLMQFYLDKHKAGQGTPSDNEIRAATGLGPNHIKAHKQYARGFCLCDEQFRPTKFALDLDNNDPEYNAIATMWLFHYNIVKRTGAGPLFWRDLILNVVRKSISTTKRSVAAGIESFHQTAGLKELSEATYDSAAGAFLGTYSAPDGLGQLKILQKRGEEYSIGVPAPLMKDIFAFMLSEYWAANWGDTHSVALNKITGDSGLAPLLLLNSGEASEIMDELHAAMLVRVERAVRPYTVFRLWDDETDLLGKIYE